MRKSEELFSGPSSTIATASPACARISAVTPPPAPLPATTTSTSMSRSRSSAAASIDLPAGGDALADRDRRSCGPLPERRRAGIADALPRGGVAVPGREEQLRERLVARAQEAEAAVPSSAAGSADTSSGVASAQVERTPATMKRPAAIPSSAKSWRISSCTAGESPETARSKAATTSASACARAGAASGSDPSRTTGARAATIACARASSHFRPGAGAGAPRRYEPARAREERRRRRPRPSGTGAA